MCNKLHQARTSKPYPSNCLSALCKADQLIARAEYKSFARKRSAQTEINLQEFDKIWGIFMMRAFEFLWFFANLFTFFFFSINVEFSLKYLIVSITVYVLTRSVVKIFFQKKDNRSVGRCSTSSLDLEEHLTRWVTGPNDSTDTIGTVFLCVSNPTTKLLMARALRDKKYFVIECDSFSAIEVLLSSGGDKFYMITDDWSINENVFLLPDIKDLRSSGIECKFIHLVPEFNSSQSCEKIFSNFDLVTSTPSNENDAKITSEEISRDPSISLRTPPSKHSGSTRIRSRPPVGYKKILT